MPDQTLYTLHLMVRTVRRAAAELLYGATTRMMLPKSDGLCASCTEVADRVRTGAQGKALDFFIVSEPTWLDERFPGEAAKVQRPCVALISTDKTWITCAILRDVVQVLCQQPGRHLMCPALCHKQRGRDRLPSSGQHSGIFMSCWGLQQ